MIVSIFIDNKTFTD